MTTGEKNPKVPEGEWSTDHTYDWHTITLLNGQKVSLKAGIYAVSFAEGEGYSIEYVCNEGHSDCYLSLPVNKLILKGAVKLDEVIQKTVPK